MKLGLLVQFLLLSLMIEQAFCDPQSLLYQKKPAFYSYQIKYLKKNQSKEDTDLHPDVYITPASCQKTLTALVAIKSLGSNYKFRTELYESSSADLLLKCSGDPTLSVSDLEILLDKYKGKPIAGKFIIDISTYQTPVFSPNIMIDDMGSKYAQPVSALCLDENLIKITITPTKIGQKANVINNAGYKIRSEVITVNHPNGSIQVDAQNDELIVKGSISSQAKRKFIQISPMNAHDYWKNKIKAILASLQIDCREIEILHRGIINNQQQFELQAVHISEPLKKIIPPALKKSDNLVFDSLFLKIIHEDSPNLVTRWEDGSKIFKKLIKNHFGVDVGHAHIVDGSGLSRYNRIKTSTLVSMLEKGYEIKDFFSALPYPGEPKTTLERRLYLPQDVRAKTGAMSGISCLCGYHVHQERPAAFALIANSFAPPMSEMTIIQDQFIRHHFRDRDLPKKT